MSRADQVAALHADLVGAVQQLADSVPCLGRDEWLSDDVVVRLQAVAECGACPVRALCGRYATVAGEKAGVWGGKDRQGTGRPVGRPRRGNAA
ncbi:WhiB family transcriptional regulator [Nakamurella sp.]|uniref:WhiB family transcriptional regulator n=1 Tax=Nakamurella sp. TaxID=1869182 RepID=UPI0037844B0C